MLVERPTDDLQGSRRPVVTWVLLPFWSALGDHALLPAVFLPILLGIAGGIAAIPLSRYWWAVLSAAWGLIIVFVMISVLMEL